MSSPAEDNPYISLADAKRQLSIDEGLTINDPLVLQKIGAAIDWAEKFCARSLGELLELNSPADSPAVPLRDPVDSPPAGCDQWTIEQWDSWNCSPGRRGVPSRDHSHSLRRDVKEALLIRIELLYYRNTANSALLMQTSEDLLFPYREGLGV